MAGRADLALLVVGLLLTGVGVGMFAWYRTAVLDGAEIARLESGGASTSTLAEFLVVASSPLLVAAGLGMVALVGTRSRRRVHP